MKKRLFIPIISILFAALSVLGQCPPEDVLINRMNYLSSSQLSTKEQLRQLLGYLDKMNNCPYTNDSTHARLARRIGGLYFRQGDYLKAVEYFWRSISIISFNISKSSVNPKELPGAYYYLSIFYDSLNNISEKLRALDSCYTVSLRINYIDRAPLKALYILAEHYFDMGDYHRCMDYARRCEYLAREYIAENKGEDRKDGEEFAWSSLLWNVKALLELKNYDEAENILGNRVEEYRRTGLYRNIGTIYSQLAEIQMRREHYDQALLFYNKAFRYDNHAGSNFNCKQTLKDIGYHIYFEHFNNDSAALYYYKKALQIINRDKTLKAKDAFESLDILTLIGNVYARRGLYDSAFYYFQLAFNQIGPGINETDILHSPLEEIIRIRKIHYLTRLIIYKGDTYLRKYEFTQEKSSLNEAIRIYKVADLFLDRIRTEQSDLQSKLFWRSDSRRLYENAINACYRKQAPQEAFYFFEKSRAVLLNDQLDEQRWVDEKDIQTQTQLKKKILAMEREFSNIHTSSIRYKELEKEIFNSKQELDELQKSIQINNPLYYQSFLDTSMISIRDVRGAVLKDHQALVELFSGDNAVYVLLITTRAYHLEKIDKNVFDTLSVAYMSYFSGVDLLNRNLNTFAQLSNKLYQLIFQNVELPAGRIIISPDGNYFPFEALVVSFRPLTYFVEDYAVSYTYSARFLLMDFTSATSKFSKTFMGFAPVRFSGLPALYGSDQSLNRIENYFKKTTNFVGSKASKDNFLREFYKYKIIQLYTHATDSGSSGEPTIYCWDSQLLLSDVLPEKKPTTNLIVLSACETAGGKLYNGEGVFNFNRQFAALGIPSSISNLWKVDNKSTYRLTELFYKLLRKGLPLDVALQKAKKEFKKTAGENQLPYYWSATILIGQSDAISFPDSSLKWMLPIIFLLILGFWNERKWLKERV